MDLLKIISNQAPLPEKLVELSREPRHCIFSKVPQVNLLCPRVENHCAGNKGQGCCTGMQVTDRRDDV